MCATQVLYLHQIRWQLMPAGRHYTVDTTNFVPAPWPCSWMAAHACKDRQQSGFCLTSVAQATILANMDAGMKVKLPRTTAELGEASRQDASLSKASEEALTVLSWVQEGAARRRTKQFMLFCI